MIFISIFTNVGYRTFIFKNYRNQITILHSYFIIKILSQMFASITGYITGKSQKPVETTKNSQLITQDLESINILQSVHSSDEKKTEGKYAYNEKQNQTTENNKELEEEQQMIIVKQSYDFTEGKSNVHPSIQQNLKNQKEKQAGFKKKREQLDWRIQDNHNNNQLSMTSDYYDMDYLNQSFSDQNYKQQTQANMMTDLKQKEKQPEFKMKREQPNYKRHTYASNSNQLSNPYNYQDNSLNQSFSDLNYKQQVQVDMTTNLRTKNSSPKQESRDSESFSGIFDASEDFEDFEDFEHENDQQQVKKTENGHKQMKIAIKKVKKSDNQLTQQQKMKKMFTQSIIQQKCEPIVHKLTPNKKSVQEPKKIQLKPEKDEQDLSISQSTYLQKVQDQNITAQNLKKKRQSFNQVRVLKEDQYLFFKFQQYSVAITIDIMNQITEEFLKLEVLVPLMHQKVCETNHALQFFKKYIDFVNQKRSAQFSNIIRMLSEKSKKKDFKKKKAETSIFDSFRYTFSQKYSKTEKIYNSINCKLSVLKKMKELSSIKDLDSEIIQNQELLGSLELLLCFERAQHFCKQKIERSEIEKNIWMSRKNQLIKERNWWITNFFPKVQI